MVWYGMVWYGMVWLKSNGLGLWLKGPTHASTAQARRRLAAREEFTIVEGKTF